MALRLHEGVGSMWRCIRLFSSSASQKSGELSGRFLTRMMDNRVDRKIQRSRNAGQAIKTLDSKRIAVLNKMYMTNITQCLAFGGFDEIVGKGVQITKVSVKDTSKVQVYWVASESENPHEVQQLLSSFVGKIRHQLIYGNMMGCVPLIEFKRDLAAYNEETLQERFKMLERDLALAGELEPEELKDQEPIYTPPVMRTDIFGFPHENVMRRIQESKNKSYPTHIPIPPASEEFHAALVNYDQMPSKSAEDQINQKKNLRKFIAQYKKSVLHKGFSTPRRTALSSEDYEEDASTFQTQSDEDWQDEYSQPELKR